MIIDAHKCSAAEPSTLPKGLNGRKGCRNILFMIGADPLFLPVVVGVEMSCA